MIPLNDDVIRTCSTKASSRTALWVSLINAMQAKSLAEVGVYRGTFAFAVLSSCPAIERYYMVDPWRHLDDWNKPANTDDDTFENYYRETMSLTAPFEQKRRVLRGTTLEVACEIPDENLDFAYIDGDHTLRGITIDLLNVYPKMADGGWLAGDDFCPSIWQHSPANEPTVVFPFARHFAEAMGARLYALPFNQFLLQKTVGHDYAFSDLTGSYGDPGLQKQFVGFHRIRYACRRSRYQLGKLVRSIIPKKASGPNQ